MVLGPLARVLAQVVVPVVAVLARAIPAAYQQALRNARQSGAAQEAASTVLRNQLSHAEALQILNLTEKATVDEIRKQSDKYFAANAVQDRGGSFYLQSKVVRARELLEEYAAEKEQQDESNQKSN